MTVGEYLVQLLERYGVDTVFGIPGVHTVELYRGLPQTRIRHITPRHEQGAGFMADGYARASQKPGVCFIITGPGMTNIATAMGQAYADSIPMLVISSVNRLNSLGMGRGELHELSDQSGMMSHVSAFSATVTQPEMLPELIARAFAVFTSERQRPVHIEIPTDVLTMSAGHLEVPGAPPRSASPAAPATALERAAHELQSAQRPVILYGGGAARAPRAALALSELLDAPSVMTINARGLIPQGHPLAVPASPSLKAVRALVDAADVVLAVGTEMGPTDYNMWDESPFHVPGRLIRIDIEGAQTMRSALPHIAVTADARDAMRALTRVVVSPLDTGGAERAEAAREAAWEEIGAAARTKIGFVERIYSALPPGAVIAGDSTQPAYACCLYLNTAAPARWFSAAAGYGTLGYALPAATGAWLGASETPAPPAVCLIGDGGLQFTMPELTSAADIGANLIVIVWNNRGYGEIKKFMIERQIKPEGVDLLTPDFIAIARACGLGAETLENADDLEAALARAQAHDGPYLIDIDESVVMDR
ncbi:MAG: 5-guanidino-2-oxopentanoate decarboxylase [Rhodospirillales bacterium]